MKITNDTTTWQIAELMGQDADERDGRIMMGIILREGYPDTDEISDEHWIDMLNEAVATRDAEDEHEYASAHEARFGEEWRA
jgi:hypothetical protein